MITSKMREASRGRSATAVALDHPALLPRATAESIDRVRRNAPPELLAMPVWVGGDRSPKTTADGTVKITKAPLCSATGAFAKSNDPKTWSTFAEAADFALRDDRCFGVGVNLLGSEYLGLDLDHVIDRTTGEIAPMATWLIDGLPPTYTELSPSGDGLRMFFRAKKPAELKRSQVKDAFGPGTQLEVYDGDSGARYLTVTGNVWVQAPIATASEEDLDALLHSAEPRPAEAESRMVDLPILSPQQCAAPPPRGRAAPNGDDAEHDIARARYVLDHVLNDPDAGARDDWLRIVQALASLGEPGRTLAREWSARGGKFDPTKDCTDAHFAGFNGRVTIATLFKMADNAKPGWRRDYDRANGITSLGGRRRQQREHGDRAGMQGGGEQAGDEPQHVPYGKRDPATGRYVLSAAKTLPTAIAFIKEHYTHADGLTLRSYGGVLWRWAGNCWREVEDAALQHRLHPWLHDALTYRKNPETKQLELVPFDSNPTTVNAALLTTRAETFLSSDTMVPSWIGDAAGRPPVLELLPCKSSTLHVPSQTVLAPTPTLFAQNALDFDYDPTAPEPVRWHSFLREILGDDTESLNLLQDWFGYCLIADTSQQKMLLLVGPRRSGKGTIARVLEDLVGAANVAGPTTGSLTGNFGLQPLLGKSLAIVSDARFSGDNIPTLVERLLCISGEDAITVDRKHLTSVTLKLAVRFMFLTNELPRFTDASTALAGRFIVLRLTKSFYGNENTNLTAELLAELPGILLWAIAGWLRLRERGRFLEPESSRTAVQDIEDLSSPVQAFVRERCVVGPGHRVLIAAIYDEWKAWCTADGRNSSTTKQMFGRDLAAAVPGVTSRRGSEYARFYDGIGLKPREDGA